MPNAQRPPSNLRLPRPFPAEAPEVAELRAQLEEKTAEVELLHEVTAGVAAARDTEAMLQFIAEIAVRVSGTESSSIYVFAPDREHLVLKAVHDAPHGPGTRTRIGRLS